MPLDLEDIQSANQSTPAPAPESVPSEPAPSESASPDVTQQLMQFPTFLALLNGKPPAIYLKQGDKLPEVAFAEKNYQDLASVGIGFFNPKKGLSVMFNQRLISPKDIASKAKEGKLDEIAVPLAVLHAALQNPTAPAAPGLAVSAPEDLQGANTGPTPSSPLPAPAPASASRKLTTARLANIALGSPTSGPVPGQGRILNNVLKPAI